ncbi:alpha-ketoglutarate-dependent dioxygenase AlkB family protein [Epilithonimonas mollis]|uniref:Alkylated DNA repair dioxygenase AlkB n=1 Tax=Epilithonimonas mollis TaxID=216903 RepID=A0A1M6T545_9FLAO|nr:alpha-ketoglutarate-dependent dioxygenase AlkB [Epilithonimonas mollis]SHK52081.1 Alkylated DNA repair dioxygenase AlkB [Epilithonimonas mollis]
MSLFDDQPDIIENILPYDGITSYYGKIFSDEEADHYFEALMTQTEWKSDQAVIFGKVIETKRKVAWYGDEKYSYTYSGRTKTALPWNRTLLKIKEKIEAVSGETFNSCLLNLYHNGSEGMAYHSDGEKDLKDNGAISSVSFGAARKFHFKHKTTKELVSLILEHGSLLMMKDVTQKFWLHRLPTTTKVIRPRISLTFRTIDRSK